MKVDELQLERQLDSVAKRLGYLEYDALRGRISDASARQAALDEMTALEDQLIQLKAQKEAAKAQAEAEARTAAEPQDAGEPAAEGQYAPTGAPSTGGEGQDQTAEAPPEAPPVSEPGATAPEPEKPEG